MVIDCYYHIYITHILTIASFAKCEYKDTLLFDKILLDFEILNCQYFQTTCLIFMKFTQIIKVGM